MKLQTTLLLAAVSAAVLATNCVHATNGSRTASAESSSVPTISFASASADPTVVGTLHAGQQAKIHYTADRARNHLCTSEQSHSSSGSTTAYYILNNQPVKIGDISIQFSNISTPDQVSGDLSFTVPQDFTKLAIYFESKIDTFGLECDQFDSNGGKNWLFDVSN